MMLITLYVLAMIAFVAFLIITILGAFAHQNNLKIDLKDGQLFCTHKSISKEAEEADYNQKKLIEGSNT